ncbi:hypothetical protein O9H32_24805 [Paenibacillus mucilaginosus]|nr:hypothetical protein [Paenibacillus caseinilyticus]
MQQQPQPSQPTFYANPGDPKKKVMSVKDWVITSLILAIPLVNIIMLFVWAFGGGANENKANFAKASLLIAAVFIGLYIIIIGVIFALAAGQ